MNEDKRFVARGHRVDISIGKGIIDGQADEPIGYPSIAIEEAVRSIRFGTVQIVIQDGRIVQIEKTEKIRLR